MTPTSRLTELLCYLSGGNVQVIGTRAGLCFELGGFWKDSLQNQHIRVWLGGKNLTSVDDLVYLPTFHGNVKRELDQLERCPLTPPVAELDDAALFASLEATDARESRVLAFDLTTMAARCHFIHRPQTSYILFSYWDERHQPSAEVGHVFRVDIGRQQIVDTLKDVLANLSTKWF